jgi:hypothetical protein
MSLCDACKAQSDAWLDYRITKPVKIASGAAYDDTLAGVADARKARFEEWRSTIRSQQAAIKRICEEQHQDGLEAPSTPAVDQSRPLLQIEIA